MRRRTFLLAGAGACAAGLGALYAPLVAGDTFEAHVADRLGIEVATVSALASGARERLGAAEYDLRAAGFAAATRSPLASLLPDDVRRPALEAYVRALLGGPSERLAYVLDRSPAAACGGLVRPA